MDSQNCQNHITSDLLNSLIRVVLALSVAVLTLVILIVVILFFAFVAVSPARAGTPNETMHTVLADLTRIGNPLGTPTQRYLDFSLFPPERRRRMAAAYSWFLNSINQTGVIFVLRPVTPDYSIMAIDLLQLVEEEHQYRKLVAAWDKIAAIDPYFGITTLAEVDGKAKALRVYGGWIEPKVAEGVSKLSFDQFRNAQPVGIVLQAPHFLWHAATTGRNGFYYDLAGVPTDRDEYIRKFSIDPDLVRKNNGFIGATIVRSGVTRGPRQVLVVAGPYGGAWGTRDNAPAFLQPNQDPFRFPLAFGTTIDGKVVQQFHWAAEEWLALNKVGHWVPALFNGEGKLQQTVPDTIAKDPLSPEGVLLPFISCCRCHTQMNRDDNGLRSFRDDYLILRRNGNLATPSPKDSKLISSLHNGGKVQRQVRWDREAHFDASVEATIDYQEPQEGQPVGLTPAEAVAELAWVFEAYVYGTATREMIAPILGIPADKFAEAMMTPLEGTIKGEKQKSIIEQQDDVLIYLSSDVPIVGNESEMVPAEVIWPQVEHAFHDAALRAEAWRALNN